MIIKPTLSIVPGYKGHNFKRNPGHYRAKLVGFEINPNGKKSYRLKWELLSHSDPSYTWIAFGSYPYTNTGLLSRMIYSWKGNLWKDLGEDEKTRCRQMLQWMYHEADVAVGVLPGTNGLIGVTQVSPPNQILELEAAVA